MKREYESSEILMWILERADDTALMDKINKLTFPFTSKYNRYVKGYGDDR